MSVTTADSAASSSSLDFVSITDKKTQRRERNREHAKRLRMRQKESLDAMKERLVELQQEAKRLEEMEEELKTASILLALGGIGCPDENYNTSGSSSAGSSEDGWSDTEYNDNASVVSDALKGWLLSNV